MASYRVSVVRVFHAVIVLVLSQHAQAEQIFRTDPTSLQEYFRRQSRPIEWEKLLAGEHRVTYLGERHPMSAIRDEIVASLGAFKKAGITHIGMEMFGDDKAALLKNYCRDGSCRDGVLEVLKKEWGWSPDSYMSLVEAARKQGIEIVPIDMPKKLKDAISEKCEAIKDFREYGEAIDKAFKDRDCRMADNLAKVLKDDPKARVAVLAGSAHVQKKTQPKHLEELHGYASKSYSFLTAGSIYADAAVANKMTGQRTFIPMPGSGSPYDGVLIVPEVFEQTTDRFGILRPSPRPNSPRQPTRPRISPVEPRRSEPPLPRPSPQDGHD